jgi:hypothetical protein
VFDLPEYAEHVPMKKKKLDVNNLKDNHRKKDHMYSDLLGSNSGGKITESKGKTPGEKKEENQLHSAGSDWSTPNVKAQIKKDYSGYKAGSKKHEQLKSSLDTHTYANERSASQIMSPEKPNI